MTQIFLQDALCEEVRRLLEDVTTTNAADEAVRGFSVYSQQLPQTEDADEPQLVPYAIVVLTNTETTEAPDPWFVSFTILFALHDADPANQGHRALVPIMERVADRFVRRPLLGDYWVAEPHIAQRRQTEDYWPFFYGAVDLTFKLNKQPREDMLNEQYYKVRQEGRCIPIDGDVRGADNTAAWPHNQFPL